MFIHEQYNFEIYQNCTKQHEPKAHACELRPISRINVNKYTFMTFFLSSLYSFKNE